LYTLYLTALAGKRKNQKIPGVPTEDAHRIISILCLYTVDITFPSGKLETKFRLPRIAKLYPVDQ